MLSTTPEAVLAALAQRYREPQRHYHTLQHVHELLARLEELRTHAERPDLMHWAIWFHDAIYDPARADNEHQSAELAAASLRALGLAQQDVARVVGMVEATAGHRWLDAEPDTALFLDLDLAILGAPPERYASYVAQVQAEYAFVPAPIFRAKRTAVLRDFLGRARLYFTEAGHQRFDTQARINLAAELEGYG
ncbi:MAG: hypothetical protein RL385_1831 [Pseudomonadota bacterium]|jgi:predicted metal-dependent HD superfamily phosphohydrolase